MLAEVIHLRRGDEEESRERFFYEQQQAEQAAQQQQFHRQELEQAAQILRSELTLEAEQYLNQYATEERAYFTSHLRNVESQLHAQVSQSRVQIQQEYLINTAEIEQRAAASEYAYAQLHHELLQGQAQIEENSQVAIAELRRELREAEFQHQLDNENMMASRHLVERERALHQQFERAGRTMENALRRDHPTSKFALNTEQEELAAERIEVVQLQTYLEEAQVQIDDWCFWYDQEYEGENWEETEEQQTHNEELEEHQVAEFQPTTPGIMPTTPPVLQGQVPSTLLPPRDIPSFLPIGASDAARPRSGVTQPVRQAQPLDSQTPIQSSVPQIATQSSHPSPQMSGMAQRLHVNAFRRENHRHHLLLHLGACLCLNHHWAWQLPFHLLLGVNGPSLDKPIADQLKS